MTVETKFAISTIALSDWFKNLAPVSTNEKQNQNQNQSCIACWRVFSRSLTKFQLSAPVVIGRSSICFSTVIWKSRYVWFEFVPLFSKNQYLILFVCAAIWCAQVYSFCIDKHRLRIVSNVGGKLECGRNTRFREDLSSKSCECARVVLARVSLLADSQSICSSLCLKESIITRRRRPNVTWA